MAGGVLDDSVSVTLDGSGNGTVKLGPISAREIWSPVSASVKTNQTTITNEARCAIYVGWTATQDNFRDQTFTGSSGDSTDKVGGKPVKSGNFIWAVWTGGDPGAVATLNVAGTKEI